MIIISIKRNNLLWFNYEKLCLSTYQVYCNSDNDYWDVCNKDKTGSSPRCHLRYHSLVCIENHLFIVGIGQILKKELEFIYQYDRSDRTYVYS